MASMGGTPSRPAAAEDVRRLARLRGGKLLPCSTRMTIRSPFSDGRTHYPMTYCHRGEGRDPCFRRSALFKQLQSPTEGPLVGAVGP